MGIGIMEHSSVQRAVLPANKLQTLIDAVRHSGYRLLGPAVENNAIVYQELEKADSLPKGIRDHQAPGNYRLEKDEDGGYFDHVVGPHSWKRYLFPPAYKLWSARRCNTGFEIECRTDTGKTGFYWRQSL